MANQRIFICPNNDGEAVAIINLLNIKNETVFVTQQGWGATWEALEERIITAVSAAVSGSGAHTVYGVELRGKAPSFGECVEVVDIDHHAYADEDRYSEKSALEQVAEILGAALTVEERFIAANDVGYIPKMVELGERLCIDSETVNALIQKIRRMDREAQGITAAQEEAAENAIKNIKQMKVATVVEMTHSKCATVTDRLYGQYDNLIVICRQDGETNFFGSAKIIEKLAEKFGGWKGGDLKPHGEGFWGGYANPDEILEYLSTILFTRGT